jgi:hypothetical protein
MKRLLALFAGGLGLGALLRRRGRPALSPSHAEDLRAKLEAAKVPDAAPKAAEHEEPAPEETPLDEAPDVASRRADVQARARQAIDELGEPEP